VCRLWQIVTDFEQNSVEVGLVLECQQMLINSLNREKISDRLLKRGSAMWSRPGTSLQTVIDRRTASGSPIETCTRRTVIGKFFHVGTAKNIGVGVVLLGSVGKP
jgi:hypothetical protein